MSSQDCFAEPPLLRAIGIRKDYGHVRALDGVDFEVRPREIHALLGDNGAGKSTLIKVIAGTVRQDSGWLEIRGQRVKFSSPLDSRNAGIECVYQDLALADPLDAAENVYLGRELLYPGLRGRLGLVNRPLMRRRTEQNLRELAGTIPSVTVPVENFSGGQRQAVAVARATLWGQTLLIMDEPVAALGVRVTEQVLDMVTRARDERGVSVILISHNLQQVMRVADRITVLRLGRSVGTIRASEATDSLIIGAMAGAVSSIGEGSTTATITGGAS